ncbi:uncharacterized protein AC631_01991 [Debaryomyces fabryi]|uniref:Uncharacterized protein n=1 Tax=Debaryomyces fabryi TaxID=58627 RepID=A0A0V1Q230_9ASCO|nr:uncharacterized protein AC631_01991 [Debaryomyces fabryi]KSA02255.1 hypothetical protein AC631_01991 [Debaryomyces fabryi]CUM46883.1 unnamed protein product [Debaryomyces fabryi]
MVKYTHNEELQFKLPVEETSADLNYAKYLDDPNNDDEFDELFLRHDAISQKRAGSIQSVTNMNLGIFGQEDGISLLNALEVNTDITAAALLRVHLLRVLMTIWLFFHLGLIHWLECFQNIRELINQFFYMLCCEAKEQAKKLKYSIKAVDYVVEAANYRYFIIERFPLVLCQFLCRNLICYSPSGFKEFQESFPAVDKLIFPQSTCLLLKINDNLLAPPPDIPQPYLDSEKEVKVPSKREYQHVLSLRNEYFTQKRTHLAAEKVRLLSEIGRFVTWNSLLSSIKFVDIYERFGCIWDGHILTVEEKLEILGASILNELCSFTNTCSKDELDHLKNIIPEITLFDIATGTKYIVHGNITEDFGYELEFPDSLDSSKPERRVLMVYLSDGRLRKELMLNYARHAINKKSLDNGPNFLTYTPDLVIVTGKTYENPLQTYGFACADENSSRSKSPLLYSRHGRFGFNQFSRSIFSYISNNSSSFSSVEYPEPARDTANEPRSGSAVTSNKSISSYVNLPSSLFTSLLKRVKRLTPFGSTSNKEVALEE